MVVQSKTDKCYWPSNYSVQTFGQRIQYITNWKTVELVSELILLFCALKYLLAIMLHSRAQEL